MPVKNVYKEYLAESYYHIYNRGVNGRDIFLDDNDRTVFLSLLKRYLGADVERRENREPRPNFYGQISLLAFCLMDNHLHLLIYQEQAESIKKFMKCLAVSYSMYFNKRYKRIGPLFQQRYKAVRISDDAYLDHISRYIHLNPKNYIDYEWSSLPYFMGSRTASWIKPQSILELFELNEQRYAEFLREYKAERDGLMELKIELANA